MSYVIKVVWRDGEEEYLKSGAACSTAHRSAPGEADGPVQVFRSKRAAEDMRDFMLAGMDTDDFQSIDIVRHYRKTAE